MAEDVSEALRNELLSRFAAKQSEDPQITAFLQKLHSQKATQADVADYADRLGELARDAIRETLTPEALPDATLYYNILQKTVGQLMKNAHRLVNLQAIEAQKTIDEAQGLSLRAVEAPFPQRRVDDLFYKAGAPGTPYEDAIRLMGEPIVTLTQAFHDDHIRHNADVRFRAGMAPKIVRTAAAGCCKWCSSIAGAYPYEDVKDAGNDVFRRHERCRCTVDYVCDGERQNVWSKKLYEADAETLDSRDTYRTSTGNTLPEALQTRSNYGLANGGNSDIINNKGMLRKSGNKGVFSVLPIRMSRKTIREIAKEFNIDIKHLSFTIDRNEELLGLFYTGRADPEHIGGITFFPKAFTSKEELVRTLYHERVHVYQYKQYGVEFVQNHRREFEEAAYLEENAFIERLKKEGRI